jgi:4Fe-4S ferredoxin
MPLKTIKKDTADTLTLEWVLHVQDYKLALDKNRCTGCQICSLACPKEAIRAEKQPKTADQKAKKATIDIDLSKCNFCGICDVLCPYGVIKVTVNGKHLLSVVEKESFPQLVRNVKANADRFPTDQKKAEEACPLDLIKVSEKGVEVDLEHCPCCRVCEFKLLQGAMQVHKFLMGKIIIHQEKCPEGCTDCVDVCPIDGALRLSTDGKKVEANDALCVYCGACKIICPVEEALELERTHVEHTPVRSGAWNKALERLASPVAMTKELKTKGSLRARESVKKRVGLKEDQHA